MRAEEITSLLDSVNLSEGLSPEIRDILSAVREQYKLNWNGIHGISHWMRVRNNGLRLASKNGADKKIVELFAFLHDSCREDDGYDLEHGERAAAFIDTLQGSVLNLSDSDLNTLKGACYYHSHETCKGNITMKTCYDADRLDLGRPGVYIQPDPRYLCTDAAKDPEMLDWSYRQSQR
jgi:uncharacterized protein